MISFQIAALAAAADDLEEFNSQLHLASFELNVLSYHEVGVILWLQGQEGDLRLEVIRGHSQTDGADLLQRLLSQEGQGWTAVLNGSGDETLNPWGEGWDFPPAGLGAAVGVLTQELAAGPDSAAETSDTWRLQGEASPSRRRVIQSLGPRSKQSESFRGQMVARGSGRGGTGEVLRWFWQADPGEDRPYLRLSISKWPGELKLQLMATYVAQIAIPEVFVPLWPLSDLVIIAESIGESIGEEVVKEPSF